jgi:hypothetical protein
MASTAAGGSGSLYYTGTNSFNVYTIGATALNLGTSNNPSRVSIGSAGNVTVAAPTSGTAVSITGVSGGTALLVTGAGAVFTAEFANSSVNDVQARLNTSSATQSAVFSYWLNSVVKGYVGAIGASGSYVTGAAAGDMIYRAETGAFQFSLGGATAAVRITSAGVLNYNADAAGTFFEVGFRDIPFNSQGTPYTLALTDRGKCINFTSATPTLTIPANASVAFPVGTIITVINGTATGNITINITTDTLKWPPAGTAGSRTVAPNGVATLLKITTTIWYITGSGIS